MAELKVPCVSKSLSTFIRILFANLPNVCCNPFPGVKKCVLLRLIYVFSFMAILVNAFHMLIKPFLKILCLNSLHISHHHCFCAINSFIPIEKVLICFLLEICFS